jgi:hypothetical protein
MAKGAERTFHGMTTPEVGGREEAAESIPEAKAATVQHRAEVLADQWFIGWWTCGRF